MFSMRLISFALIIHSLYKPTDHVACFFDNPSALHRRGQQKE